MYTNTEPRARWPHSWGNISCVLTVFSCRSAGSKQTNSLTETVCAEQNICQRITQPSRFVFWPLITQPRRIKSTLVLRLVILRSCFRFHFSVTKPKLYQTLSATPLGPFSSQGGMQTYIHHNRTLCIINPYLFTMLTNCGGLNNPPNPLLRPDLILSASHNSVSWGCLSHSRTKMFEDV